MARVVFVQALACEFPGTHALSASLKARGHAPDVLISPRPDPADPVLRGADILAFSVMTGHEAWAVAAARRLKASSGATVVFGGPHPTHCPEIVREPGVDAVCRGEGDEVLADLADQVDAGGDLSGIPGLWVKRRTMIIESPVRPPPPDLGALPQPDRELYYRRYRFLARAGHKAFMAGRGCPYACTFCSNEALRTLYAGVVDTVRLRRAEALVQEIEGVRDRYGLRRVLFHDDTFVLRRGWLEEFLELYRARVRLPFTCQSRADTLSADLAERLASAGCRVVFFAVESGVEAIRQRTLGKDLPDARILEAARLLKACGIRVGTYNMVGAPGERLADALETARLNIRIGADLPRCSFLTPYPGTRIAALCRESGLVRADGPGITPLSQQRELLVANPDARKLKRLHALFQTAVLVPPAFPLIRVLVRLPLTPLYAPWWALVYGWVLLRGEGRGVADSLRFLWFAARQMLRRVRRSQPG